MNEGAPETAPLFALPADQQSVVGTVFALDQGAAHGYRVETISIDRSRVRATYRGPDETRYTLLCQHPEDDPDAERRTPSFTLRGDLPSALLDLVEASLRAHEGEVRWLRLESKPRVPGVAQDLRDAELLAFLRGVKPALRRTEADLTHAEELVKQIERSGRAACLSRGELRLGSHRWWVVYGANTLAEAEHLRTLDASPWRVWPAAAAHDNRELGRGLGYPECCIEGFVSRDRRTRGLVRRWLGLNTHYRHLAAREAWSAHSRWQLNPHLMGEGASLISFEPCSYTCPAALKIARATFRLLFEEDARAAAELERRLRCTLAIDADGSITRLDYTRDARHELVRLRDATPVCEVFGQTPSPSASARAAALREADLRLGPPNWWNDHASVVIDFDGRAD